MHKILLNIICCLGFLCALAQDPPATFQNPILPGFHPDPSICRVGEDYYLVNSSFEWYPGLPVYHSRDLVNWQLIGYGLQRPDQIDLPVGLPDSRGMYAPTIRYHEGTFYLICTCVRCEGNFYLTASDPAGPWSDPVWLGSRGIDPSLFWDDDGRCYYVGHANISGKTDWPNKNGVWMQELDLQAGKLVGEPKQLTHGHATNARWTEGPHLYSIAGKYLLMVAEGGTDFHHAVTTHLSDSLWGPYVPTHSNPVISHRQLGSDYPIYAVGHADLVQTAQGDWWAVMLAKRRLNGMTALARETFLTPIRIEMQEGMPTPVFNPGEGKLLSQQARPTLSWTPWVQPPPRDEFDGPTLPLVWNFLRSPRTKWWQVQAGKLNLALRPEVADSLGNPSLIARRIESHRFVAGTALQFHTTKQQEVAGLIVYRNSLHHLQLLKSSHRLILRRQDGGAVSELASVPYEAENVCLWVEADGLQFTFYFGTSEENRKAIGGPQSMRLISDEVAGGFNGPYVGMYASSQGQTSAQVARFEWFEYKTL